MAPNMMRDNDRDRRNTCEKQGNHAGETPGMHVMLWTMGRAAGLRLCIKTGPGKQAAAWVRLVARAVMPGIAGITLSACAAAAGVTQIARTTYSVERLGHGTYSVRTHSYVGVSGLEDAKADNARAAAKYCAKKGLVTTVVVSDTGYGGVAPDDTLTFRCGTQATVSVQGNN